MATVAEIRVGARSPEDAAEGPGHIARTFGLPGEVIARLADLLRPFALTPDHVLSIHEDELRAEGFSSWALIFFGEEYPLAGHVASLRGGMWNVAMASYARLRGGQPEGPQPVAPAVGLVSVRKKAILKTLAERSPLFRSAWEALKSKADDRRWICLSDAPPAEWVAATAPGDGALLEEHRCRAMQVRARVPETFADREWALAYRLGMEAYEGRSWERCVTHLAEVVAQDASVAEAWHFMGMAHGELGDWASASGALNRASELRPYWIGTHIFLASSHRKRRLYSQAEAGFRRVLELDPFLEDAWYFLAGTCAEAKRFEQATAAGERLLELEPRSMRGWGMYGFLLLECGRLEEAALAFEKQVELNPDDVIGLNNLGFCRARMGRGGEAIQALEKAVRLDPRASYAWDSLGYAHLRAGRFDEAISALLKAIELRPEHHVAWRHLVHAYHRGRDDRKFASAYAYLKGISPGEAAKTERELASGTIE